MREGRREGAREEGTVGGWGGGSEGGVRKRERGRKNVRAQERQRQAHTHYVYIQAYKFKNHVMRANVYVRTYIHTYVNTHKHETSPVAPVTKTACLLACGTQRMRVRRAARAQLSADPVLERAFQTFSARPTIETRVSSHTLALLNADARRG